MFTFEERFYITRLKLLIVMGSGLRYHFWFHKINNSALILLLSAIVQTGVYAQDPPFISYNEQTGLSTSVIYGLFQDSEDNIWFCTNSGPVKFNGNKLVFYKKKDGLAGNEVFKVFEDSQHRLWFMTASGQISYYKNKKIYNQNDHPIFLALKINAFIADIREDRQGKIWVIPDRGNIYSLSPNLDNYREVPAQVFNANFFTYKDHNYISSREGIFEIDKGLRQVNFHNYIPSILGARHCFYNNLVYVGRNKHVEIYDMDNREVRFFETPDLPVSINSISIIDSFIYICSAGGLSLYNRNTLTKAGHYFRNVNVSHVLKDREGSLWLSTLNEGVLYIPNMHVAFLKSADYFHGNKVLKLNGLGNHVVIGQSNSKADHYNLGLLKPIPSLNESRGEGRTYTIMTNSSDSSFIISNQAGITRYSLNGSTSHLANVAVLSYAETFDDSVYLGTPSIIGKFSSRLKTEAFFAGIYTHVFDSVRADVLYFDRNDSILYAGTKNGMLLYKGRTKHIARNKRFDGMSFTDIDKDRNGVFIATTLGDGIFFFDNDKQVQLNEKTGLTDNMCTSLFLQNDSTVWVTTLNGLNRIIYRYRNGAFTGISIRNYYRNDGLPSNYINDIYIYGDSIWLATNTGLAVFNENDLPNYSYTPKMVIEAFKSNDGYRNFSSSTPVELERNSNNIVIEFNCRTFKNSVSVWYKYKLSGLNNTWIETRNNQVDFTGLPPGKYEFAVYAYSLNENWKSNIERLYFTIKPAYWETTWFRILIGSAALFLISLLVYYRFRKVKNKFTLQKKIINYEKEMLELEQQALRLQMNPHFIFNALNSVQHAILAGRQNDAYNSLELFSSLIRGILENSKYKFISLEDEIEILEIYIQIEAKRFNADFNYEIKTDPDIDISSIKIPPMLIQPFVENSIWHGLMPKTTGEKKLELSFTGATDAVICKVEDNGIGRLKAAEMKSRKQTTSLGTALTLNRVANINMLENKNRYAIEIYDKPENGGTIVTITIKR